MITNSDKKNATSYEVAKLAGVSQTSVSRVFNPKWDNKIKFETREKVFDAASKLGYNPNAIARSLIAKRTKIIGIILPKDLGRQQSYNLNMLIHKLQMNKLKALVLMVDPKEKTDQVVLEMLQYRVDAIIMISTIISEEMSVKCNKINTPVILYNRENPKIKVNSVSCNFFETGEKIADLFLDTGHKKIAIISGRNHPLVDYGRENGFTSRLEERGVTDWLMEKGDYSYESGYNAGKRLLTKLHRPDAIYCVSDVMAQGAMDVARYELGLSVPDDVSIIGLDDLPESARKTYLLTTFRYPLNNMMDKTIEILKEVLENGCDKPISEIFEMKLVIRNTLRY